VRAGDHRGKPSKKPALKTSDDKDTAVNVESSILALIRSAPGRNLIRPSSSPRVDNPANRAVEEIVAEAIPTSSVAYNRAAAVQKISPRSELTAVLHINQ
jgi:hypothetical protein